jgi:hypothetical protein
MCPHTLHHMKCHTNLSPLYTSIRVQDRSPSISQHHIRLSCACEAPTQTHKSHHQTHEAPTSFQWCFSPNKECNVVPTMIPTCPTSRACENTCLKLHKSTIPLCEGGILTTLHNHLEIALSPTLGVALSTALDPLPQLLSNLLDWLPSLPPKQILLSNLPNWLHPQSLKQILLSIMIPSWKTSCS